MDTFKQLHPLMCATTGLEPVRHNALVMVSMVRNKWVEKKA